MDLIKVIKERIYNSINVIDVDLIDESRSHASHYSTTVLPSHIQLMIVSDDFIGMNSIKRHRLIYKLLENEIKLLHAVSLCLYTKDEYNQPETEIFIS
ncbi:bolA protein [Wolbachia pipientis]|uniref:BolA protein n=1 Tax=Wolbachia pipientis TaxID=955 RepID=A0A1E7QJD3_WOLPI|nr:BolA family protein [Wolbachia pipientis]OEY86487.1 bolA protein [Wolbachia pipientis]